MKKNIFLIGVVLLLQLSSLAAADLSSVKSSLNSAQKELTTITMQRDNLLREQEQLKAEYTEVLDKISAKEDKPKSLSYKNAVKKGESLNDEIKQKQSEIDELNRQIDSLKKSINAYQSEIQSIQQAEDEAKRTKEEITKTNQVAKEQVIQVEKKQQPEQKADNDVHQDVSATGTSPTKNPKKTDSDDDDSVMFVIILILLFILYIIYKICRWVNRHKCPNCHKKWALDVVDEEDCGTAKKERVKGSDGNVEWVYYHKIKVIRQCKHCGHQVWHIEVRKEA